MSAGAAPISAQTRSNRQIAGRKAAAAKKLRWRMQEDDRREREARELADYGPRGRMVGTAPVDFSISELLDRIREAGSR